MSAGSEIQPTSLAEISIDEVAVLRQFKLTPAAILVCQRYGLDPILKHVVIVDGSVYVTRDGLLALAHRSGQFDGLEVEKATLDEAGKEWQSRASVYRKDMGRPFAFSGRYPTGKKNSPEMAEKVAVARALKHAFDVDIPTEDERHLSTEQAHREPVDLGAALTARREAAAEAWPETAQPPVDAVLVDEATGEVAP